MRKKLPKPVLLKDFLQNSLKQITKKPSPQDGLELIQHHWHQLVPAPLHQKSKAIKIVGKKLIVLTASPVWMQEWEYHRVHFLEMLRELLPRVEVEGVRCQMSTFS